MSILSRVLSSLATVALTTAIATAGIVGVTLQPGASASAPEAGFSLSSSSTFRPDTREDQRITAPASGEEKLLTLPRSMPVPHITRSDTARAPQLLKAGLLAPGTAIYNERTGMRCSTGHIAGNDARVYVITAGHCGNTGDRFYYLNDAGRRVIFGEMWVESENTNFNGYVNSSDIGLIEITNPRARYNSSPGLDGPLVGWISYEELERTRPTVCRIGSSRGLSCGNYLGINRDVGGFYFANDASKGDSGGAVYAEINGQYYAVGVYSAYIEEVEHMHLAMEMGSVLTEHKLSLYN